MITIEGYKNEALSSLEDKVSELLKDAISKNRNEELWFFSDLYSAIGIAIIRNNANGEVEL